LEVSAALLQAWPDAVKEKNPYGRTPLHTAYEYGAPLEVVAALLQVCPDASKEKDEDGYTPLHLSCRFGAPLEAVAALLQVWPDAAKEKNEDGNTPLHLACQFGAPLEVMFSLLQVWPDATKEKDLHGRTPLQKSCCRRVPWEVVAPLEEVAALLQVWPDAVKEKDRRGYSPLHCACRSRASLQATTLLLNTWLGYKENTTKSQIMALQPLQGEDFYFTGDVEVLFSHLFALCNNNTDNHYPKETIDYFIRIELWNGVTLVLDRHPTLMSPVTETMGLDTKVMADFLSTVGRCCRLTTMWEVLCNEQDLLEGVQHLICS